ARDGRKAQGRPGADEGHARPAQAAPRHARRAAEGRCRAAAGAVRDRQHQRARPDDRARTVRGARAPRGGHGDGPGRDRGVVAREPVRRARVRRDADRGRAAARGAARRQPARRADRGDARDARARAGLRPRPPRPGGSQETPSATEQTGAVADRPEARLVVVDDEPTIRELLTTSLRFAGFEVHAAADGASALALVRDLDPDLVVLDVMLPDMDGFTVTRRMRERGEHVPVVFLTAKDDPQDTVTGLTVGGDDYVTKPFS